MPKGVFAHFLICPALGLRLKQIRRKAMDPRPARVLMGKKKKKKRVLVGVAFLKLLHCIAFPFLLSCSHFDPILSRYLPRTSPGISYFFFYHFRHEDIHDS